ncbi:hypothetical protein F7725_009631 [Dissostichus mawsoni]|uniref:PiggyBac transposable element-derived protein domain-containing protein n=1 Tax=Dissostichus mawsoni TaxID=36200 RepID=A0A7J5XLY9_DISMA|nr:hypothetical protein F7725_009631 [Dissostichus mawsoni]
MNTCQNTTSKERSSIQCAGCDCCHPKRRKWVRTGISGMICDFDVYQGSLLARGIHYVGTARQARLPNCNLEKEKSMKKKGRGSFDIRVEANHNICAVKWYDSRAVTLVSSFAGPDPVQRIQRWDKANKTYVEVERPYIVGYNKYMGGVDLLDSFTAKYKFPMKSRRWYVDIFWHTIILAVINAWLLVYNMGTLSSEYFYYAYICLIWTN